MRLIDKGQLEPDTEWDEYEDGYVSYSKMQIDNAPTVDAVPVVRCRDCKEYDKVTKFCRNSLDEVESNWFCLAGMRKESEL